MSPLRILLIGGDAWAAARARELRAAIPGLVVQSVGVGAGASTGTAAAEVSAVQASALAHLALGDGRERAVEAVAERCDAVARTETQVREFIERAVAFERRRRAHRLPPDLPPAIAPWSPGWAGAAARLGDRISAVFGERDADVQHIGSTSVEGLPAKDIIDLQVSVDRLGTCDEVADDLQSAGFVDVQALAPLAPGVARDHPRDAVSGPDQWEKRLYAGVDSDQRVIVHVRRRGAANWRYALLFRDWLRADAAARDEYAELKAGIAAEHARDAHFDDYARAKDFWFDRAAVAAEAWTRSCAWTPTR